MVYDSLARITSWTRTGSNAGIKTFADIDNLGNFHNVSSNGTSQNISYSYSTLKPNELTSYSNSATQVGYNFTYNSNGAVTIVEKTLNSIVKKRDFFYYSSSGLVSDLVSYRGDTTIGYSYRYNWQGARESKRVVKEQYGTTNLSNLDAMYYLTDASGASLIEYYRRRSGAAKSDTVAYSVGY